MQILRSWRWIFGVFVALLLLAGLGVAAPPLVTSLIRARIVSLLKRHYRAQLQVRRLDVSLFPVIRITGDGLVLRPKERPEAPPQISVSRFSTSTNFLEILETPPRVHQLVLEGLHIQVSRRHNGNQRPEKPRTAPPETAAAYHFENGHADVVSRVVD